MDLFPDDQAKPMCEHNNRGRDESESSQYQFFIHIVSVSVTMSCTQQKSSTLLQQLHVYHITHNIHSHLPRPQPHI